LITLKVAPAASDQGAGPKRLEGSMDTTPQMTGLATEAAEAWSALAAPFARGGALPGLGQAWATEVAALMAERLRADADALLALRGCTTPVEVAQWQQRWFSDAARSYAESSTRLMGLAMRAATTAADPLLAAAGATAAETASGGNQRDAPARG